MTEDKCRNKNESFAPNPTDNEEIPFAPDDVFDALAGRHRRWVLYLLAERGGTVAVDDLAELVVAVEREAAPEPPPTEAGDRVRARLHHAALPNLADRGFVEYDGREAVTFARRAEPIRPCLEFALALEEEDVRELLATL